MNRRRTLKSDFWNDLKSVYGSLMSVMLHVDGHKGAEGTGSSNGNSNSPLDPAQAAKKEKHQHVL